MIKFGTGGWRSIIADGFTKKNVQILAQALCDEMTDTDIVIGYDRRFLSDIASYWLAEVFAANNIKVHLIDKAAPTPLIMFGVRELDTDYGLAVTASHNPALYNGVKVFTKGGRDATEEVTNALQKRIDRGIEVKSLDYESAKKSGLIVLYNPQNRYLDSILDFINVDAIKNANLSILVDTMYGVSKTSLSVLLNTTRCETEIINDRHDTLFGGKLPSPESSTLHKLSNLVIDSKFDMGIATDGDADRIGIIDENGRFIHPNLLLSLIYEYLLVEKKWDGPVVRNLSTTHLLDKIAKKHGQYAVETPVGFKHITENMDKHKAIIGGESSGGLTISGHIKGKDGIFAAMLLVEMVAVTGKKIGQLVSELYREYGDLYNKEQAYSFDQDKKDSINNLIFIEKKVPDFDSPIKSVSYLDGLKVYFDNDSWVSARFSGTEPLLRIFAESSSQDETEKIINNMEEFLEL